MNMPEGFCELKDYIPDLVVDAKYFTDDNFMGRPADGYRANKVLCTVAAAKACAKAADALRAQGYRMVAWDGYRPLRAVADFCRWGEDVADQRRKAIHYPNVEKAAMFTLGYIAPLSSHSRGTALDVGLCDMEGNLLDFGTCFDFMDERSWPMNKEAVSPEAYRHRMILREAMLQAGFRPFSQEWWHFNCIEDPTPDRYFDFVIE